MGSFDSDDSTDGFGVIDAGVGLEIVEFAVSVGLTLGRRVGLPGA